MQNAADFTPEELTALNAKVLEQAAEISHFKLVIAKLRRMQFGRRSEQIDQTLGQLELSLEDLEAKQAEREASVEAFARTVAARSGSWARP